MTFFRLRVEAICGAICGASTCPSVGGLEHVPLVAQVMVNVIWKQAGGGSLARKEI
jgi:hypothetical protein